MPSIHPFVYVSGRFRYACALASSSAFSPLFVATSQSNKFHSKMVLFFFVDLHTIWLKCSYAFISISQFSRPCLLRTIQNILKHDVLMKIYLQCYYSEAKRQATTAPKNYSSRASKSLRRLMVDVFDAYHSKACYEHF